MSDELTRLRAELEQIEQALAAADGLPPAQRETILSALRGQRGALQAQIIALAGSGAIAQDGGVAAGEGGIAVGGAVQGGVSVTEVHYHTIGDTIAIPTPGPEFHHNLPQPDYGTFIGREEELAKIHQLLLPYPDSRYHIVTIDGIGGIGKSALALEAAYRYARKQDSLAQDKRFDAIIWTSAKQTILTAEGIISRRVKVRTLDDIYTTIAATLERDDITQARPEERPAVVTRALARQRTLLIVDNLETVDDEQVIAFIREAPDPTKVMVTTRQRIAVAYPVRLVEMMWEDAQQLIGHECESQGVALTGEQTRKLYDRTGGVPLALVWSISRIALGEDVQLVLRRLGRPDSDVARFCFEGVVKHLRDNESYKLLIASALFAQDAPRQALGHVAGIEDELSCQDGLIALERLSLLNRQADRFSLLPLTRSYLDHELERAPQFAGDAFERMLTYYKQLVTPPEEILMGVPYWDGLLNYYTRSESLRPEWSNIARIFRRALAEDRYTAILDLFLPIVHLMNAWGLWDERLEFSHEACRAANQLQDPSEAWLWIDAIGWVLLQRQRVPEFLDALKTGRLVAHQFDLVDALILADAFEARLYSSIGDTSLAHRRIESALAQVDLDSILECGSKTRRFVASRVVGTAALLSQSEQDFVRAREWQGRELSLRQSTGQNQSPTLWRLGHINLRLGDVAAAESYLAQALDGAAPKDVAWARYGLALVAEQKGEIQEAQHLCELALEQFTRLGLANGIQECQELLARLRG